MRSFPHRPNLHTSAALLARSLRWVRHTLRSPALLSALSWLSWLAIVGLFAIWTSLRYQAPARPAWIGMTIRTGVFAAWMLVLREWLALRWHTPRDTSALGDRRGTALNQNDTKD